MTRKFEIDWAELWLDFESPSGTQTYYLDRRTGAVVLVTDEVRRKVKQGVKAHLSDLDPLDLQELKLARAMERDPERFLPVPEQNSYQEHREMEAYIGTVVAADPELANLLRAAIEGRNARAFFEGVLLQYPAEREGWWAWWERRRHGRILDWLASEGITPARVPGPGEALDWSRVPDSPQVPEPRQALPAAREALIADLTLLTLYLSSWEESAGATPKRRAWKGHRFEVIDALEQQGLIAQGRRAKSLYLTEEGLRRARALEKRYAARRPAPNGADR